MMKSFFAIGSAALLPLLFHSATSSPIAEPAPSLIQERGICNADKPSALQQTSSCYGWNWGNGCGWSEAGENKLDEGWTIQHEGYTAYDDYDAPVQVHGNDCEGTVLECKGTHGSYSIPNPSGGAKYFYLSDSRCALKGLNPDALFSANSEGTELKQLLDKEGNDQGFTGDFSTLKSHGSVPDPGPYTCTHSDEGTYFVDQKIVCQQFYTCVDTAASITAYFPNSANMPATGTTQPTVKSLGSEPGTCSKDCSKCNEDGCPAGTASCCDNGTC